MSQYYRVVVAEVTSWIEGLAATLPNMVVALVVVTAFALAARPISRVVRNVVSRISDSDVVTRLASRITRYAVILMGAFIALGVVGLDKTLTSLLAGAGVIGIALGFAFQDIAANFVAGVIMGVRNPFKIGDMVETNGFMGVVTNLNLRSTTLETLSGQTVIIPNKEVFTEPLINYYTTGHRRVEVDVGISYDDDVERAVTVARDAVEAFDFLSPDKEVDVIAHAFGASSVDLKVRYWVPYPGDTTYPAAVHHGVVALKKAFDAEGIDIPFPIRTLDLGDNLFDVVSKTASSNAPSNGEASRAS